jgi:hypothetical protein
MKLFRVIHQAGEGTATWTLTAFRDGEADIVYTISPAMGLDVSLAADGLTIEKDATDLTPATFEHKCTIYLRDSLQVFPDTTEASTADFVVCVFFWAWLTVRLLR